MGGRGSLSPNRHIMYDKASIKAYMKAQGVTVHGLNNISRKGLSVVVEALETLDAIQKKHGKRIENVFIGNKSNADFSYVETKKFTKKGSKDVILNNILFIPKKTVQGGKADLEREVKYANRHGIIVAKNVKQMIYHEYGHAMHNALKVTNPGAYNQFEAKFSKLMKKPTARVSLSGYAQSKTYTKRSQSVEYVAESMVHILRNTQPKKGTDMVDLVRNYMSYVPNSRIPLTVDRTPTKSPTRRKRGSTIRNTSGRSRRK